MTDKIYNIKVIPNSKTNKIIETKNNFFNFKIKLAAPAQNGKANKALLEFLSQQLKISKSKIKIIAGETSRTKKIKILL